MEKSNLQMLASIHSTWRMKVSKNDMKNLNFEKKNFWNETISRKRHKKGKFKEVMWNLFSTLMGNKNIKTHFQNWNRRLRLISRVDCCLQPFFAEQVPASLQQNAPIEKQFSFHFHFPFLKNKKIKVRALPHCHNRQNCHFVVKACPPFCSPSRDWFISKPYCSVSWTPLSSSSPSSSASSTSSPLSWSWWSSRAETWKVFSQQEESV